MKGLYTAAAICMAVTITGCTSAETTTGSTDTATPPPVTTAVSTTPALPEVTFNPCDTIDDALLVRFEVDPAERDRHEFSLGREDILACNILGEHRTINIVAQNTPWDDIPFRVAPQAITVNGRQAWYVPGGTSEDSCSVLMRTDFGAVIVEHTVRRGGTTDPNMDRCDRIMELAEAVEPLIDNEN
ncbi:DUF3558 family protein [Millisia brevis]|uniref:DUF3558 family protein n=1 Tax=Millisia brevis TaxID=264148 RepID=UPI0009FFB11E|nr:DUF3558 family protein [Millisia brevis]